MPNDFLQSFLAGRQEGAVNKRQNQALGQQQAEMLQRLGLAQSQMSEQKRQFDLEQAFRAQQAKAQQEHLARQEQMEAARSVAGGLINPVAQGQVTSNPNGMFELGGQMYTPATLQQSIDRAGAISQAQHKAEYESQADARIRQTQEIKNNALNFLKEHPDMFPDQNERDRWLGTIVTGHSIPEETDSQMMARMFRGWLGAKTPQEEAKYKRGLDMYGRLKQSMSSIIPMLNYNNQQSAQGWASKMQAEVMSELTERLKRPPTPNELMSAYRAYASSRIPAPFGAQAMALIDRTLGPSPNKPTILDMFTNPQQ